MTLRAQVTDAMAEQPTPSETRYSPPDGGRWTLAPYGFTLVALSAAVSAAGYATLPARMRVHWSFGYPYVGPEFAPTVAVLVAFPATLAALALAGSWLDSRLRDTAARAAVALTVLGTLSMGLLLQAALVVANL